MDLEPFQGEGANFLASREAAILADEAGLGKTIQALHATALVNATNILILCPNAVKYQWRDKILEYYPDLDPEYIEVLEGSHHVYQFNNPPIVISSYNLLIYEPNYHSILARYWDVLILDEVHFLKSIDSVRSIRVLGRNGIAWQCKRWWALSATPITNRPVELYPILSSMFPQAISDTPDYVSFIVKYCGAEASLGAEADARGATNVKELAERLRPYYLRRTIEEVMGDVLKPTVEMVDLTLDEGITNVLIEEEKRLEDPKALVDDPGASARLRRQMGVAKVDQSWTLIEQLFPGECKVIIVFFHHDVVNRLVEGLNKNTYRVVVGKQSRKKRKEARDAYLAIKEIKYLFLQIQAGGTGLDGLQRVCHRMVFVEWDWCPKTIEQTIGRLYRIGQKSRPLILFLMIKGTLENIMWRVQLAKDRVLRKLIN